MILDLDGNGFDLTGIQDSVKFDIDANGSKEKTSWTDKRSQEAFLALDRNGNGRIDSALELFGDATRFLLGNKAENGYQALFELEVVHGNGNGVIGPEDEIYSQLLLWLDRNHNRHSEKKELVTLVEAGVLSISVEYRVVAGWDEHGNKLRFRSHATITTPQGEKKVIETADVFFVVDWKERDLSMGTASRPN